jgi:hypothetical protein
MSIRETKTTAISLLDFLKLLNSFSINGDEYSVQRQWHNIGYPNLNRGILPDGPVREKRLHDLHKALRAQC